MDESSVNAASDSGDESLDSPTIAPHLRSQNPHCYTLGSTPAYHSISSPQYQDIDDYEVLGEIARGSMGVVYRARHTGLDRTVSLKMILDSGSQTELSRKRFLNEAQAAASLDHPGIVPVYDVGSCGGFPYFTMAYIEGTSLATLLATGPLEAKRSAEIAEQIARAAAHAHQHHIIHRDLKPANVLIDAHGTSHVTDFGVSKSLKVDCDLTSNGEVVGTPHYMPPEQASGRGGEIGPASDVYSIGAILYAMLTGRPPFQAATPIEVISQVLNQDPVPPRALNASIPLDLEIITLKCLSKSTHDRYAEANFLGDDLQRYLRGEPILAMPPGVARKLMFFIRRHVMWASVSGSVAMVLVLLTSIVMWSYLRAQSRILDLEDDLAIAEQQVASERVMLTRFLSQHGEGSIEASQIAQLELDRITTASNLMLAAGKTDLAFELAVEAVRFSQANSISVPKESLKFVLDIIAEYDTASSADQSPVELEVEGFDREQVTHLLEQASQRITHPMSPTQRNIFGLNPTLSDDSETTHSRSKNAP